MEGQLTTRPSATRRELPLPFGVLGDERLAQMVGRGSERAFAALYERHHQALYRYCRSILRSDADAQDALQSALARALVALRRGRRDAPLLPWLFRIAHNESISLTRRRRAEAQLGEHNEPRARSAAEQAEERATIAQLLADLQSLPERGRAALVMRELSGLSHEEIAIALETTPGAAKQAIFEARGALLEREEGRALACEEVRRRISDGDGRVLRGRRLRAHLSACPGCAAFAAAIPARRAELGALAPPLAPVAAAGLLAHFAHAGSSHGSLTLGGIAAGGAGKTAGGTLAVKALLGVTILSAATLGVSRVVTRATPRGSRSQTQPAGGLAHGPAAGRALRSDLRALPAAGASASRRGRARAGRRGEAARVSGLSSVAQAGDPLSAQGEQHRHEVGARGLRAHAHPEPGNHSAKARSRAGGSRGSVHASPAQPSRRGNPPSRSTTRAPAHVPGQGERSLSSAPQSAAGAPATPRRSAPLRE